MKYLSYTSNGNTIELQTTAGKMRLQPRGENIVHVQYTLAKQFSTKPSLMVLPAAQQESQVGWVVEDTDDALLLSTASLRLKIDKQTCAFTWMDSAGNLLVREPEVDSKLLTEVDVAYRKAYSAKLSLVFSEEEAIYGLGQHEEGVFNYRGKDEYLYHHNLKVAMPVLVSTKGYAFFFDSYSLGNFHDDKFGTYYWSEVEDELDFYFLYGPEFDQIVSAMRELTGKPTLFPRWAYGYVQSKERYKTQAELIETVKEYRRRNIPLDCIVLDWMSWPDGLWGQKTFDLSRFPDPSKMMDDLHELGAHLMISIWPKVRNNGPNHVELREGGYLLGDGVTYDAYDPEARAVYWRQANEGLFAHGIDAWWCDSTEPYEPDWFGTVKPEPWQRLLTNINGFKAYIDPEKMNAYSLLHSQGMYEGQRSVTGQKRVVNLTRSGYPGQQRYGTITWSGDITARWETLRNQLPAGLNFVVTGSPRWTFDIGGFFVKHNGIQWFWDGGFEKGCEDLGYRELFVRWFQLGAFLPMFRAHGTDTPREVWNFGEPGDPMYETLVKFCRLRSRLMPYIYSLAGLETHEDYTMMRSLVFDFRGDPKVYNVGDQFMLGPALMVCPVSEPMYYLADSEPITDTPRQREVYLPSGCDWYDFWTGTRYSGGQKITAEAPIDRLPLYVKAGSILPFGPETQYADQQPGAPVTLWVYPGADSQFQLYNDAGDGYGYENGEFSWTPITWDDSARMLSIGPCEGAFDGMPAEQRFFARIAGEGKSAGSPDAGTPEGEVGISGKESARLAL